MKLSLGWLARYVALDDLTPERIRDELTMSTAEIEGITRLGEGLDDVVVGHVVTTQKHPNADKLTLAQVDAGLGSLQSIVCGAPNVAAGQKVAVALPGTTLPGGVKIQKAKLRGVESLGMICSERELGLTDDHSGIWILPADAKPGAKLVDALPVRDVVFDLDNKSINHRPDLWGHFGVARELAAILGRPLCVPKTMDDLPVSGAQLELAIEDRGDCPRFTGLVLRGVRVQPSPVWLQLLLRAVGQRPINLPVDLTNFVMFELGQPLHAFDRRWLAGDGIVVRRAKPDERMTTLDGCERALEPYDLLVTSGGKPVALAGIMGGAGSAVADDSTELFLESANFHPARVRRTSTRLALRTEASTRFEKSLDPAGAELASRRFAQLLVELCPGAAAAGPLSDPTEWRYQPRAIDLRRSRLDLKLGQVVPQARVSGFFTSLQFGVEATADGWRVQIPSFRATKDLTIEDDLIEEVGRMFRYDNIAEQPLRSVIQVPPREGDLWLARTLVKLGATELACHEVYNYSFVPDRVLAAAGILDQPHAIVSNPVAPEITRMRRHVLPSLLACVAANLREQAEVRLLEHGKGYAPEQRDEHGLPHERREIAIVWSRREGASPYAELRSRIERLLARVGCAVEIGALYDTTREPWLHPRRTVALTRGKTVVGSLGVLHPAVGRAFEIPATTAVATIDVRQVLAAGGATVKYTPVPRFPSQRVDVALLVSDATRVGDLRTFLEATGGAAVRSVKLFEIYRGAGLPPGMKSVNFTVALGADDRTLEAKDCEQFLARVRAAVSGIGGELRG